MAVTDAFKSAKLFGLAVGLTMCGSGVGSFSANPFIAWMLESWTWRELMLIESAILLHSMVSASCFHHLDAINFRNRANTLLETKNDAVEAHPEDVEGLAMTEINDYALEDDTEEKVRTQCCARSCCIETVWSFLRYILCLPSRYRFKQDSLQRKSQLTSIYEFEEASHDDSCVEFWNAFTVSLKQLVSTGLWRNPDFLAYIIANSLTGLGVVIPWTFIYDHCLISLSRDGELDHLNASHVSWLPALIGLGSLSGQIFFGLVTSRFCNCLSKHSSPEPGSELAVPIHNPCSRFFRHVQARSRCFLLFAGVLAWNGLTTLLIALLPFDQLATQVSSSVSFFQFPIGITMGAACFLTGISYGGLYVLYPQILMQTVGEQLWAAGLGVFLFLNGAMNLVGTTISGRLFDSTGSYTPAFLVAACIPFVGLLVLAIEQLVQYQFTRGVRRHSTTSA
ncbi:unnamed protein product [Dicrocoelium dendriticum]|nr:unnamed protein product [Dicrocoelium dendriticum]